MELWVLLIVAGIIVVIVVAVAAALGRRGSSVDKPGDRGPYSSNIEATGSMAAMGTTLNDRPDAPPGGDADEG